MKSIDRASNNIRKHESDLLEIVQAIYIDACAKCTANVSDLRDLTTIKTRVKDEGLSFLTITLPEFARDFQAALRSGCIDPTSFRRFRKNGRIPAFLQGFVGLIFNRETGGIYDDESPNYISDCSIVIDSVRQICLAFKKIELPCSPKRVSKALRAFVQIEQDLQGVSVPAEVSATFVAVSSVLWDNVVASLCWPDMFPKHGPGATADKRVGNHKYTWHVWHDRLEPFFPLVGNAYCMGVIDQEMEMLSKVTIVSQEHEQPVKVVCVPKTLKTPRIIAIEPCCVQYAQQAIRAVLYKTLESSWFLAGQINFRDQSINQELAITSSKTGQFATIDLADASDRVPRDLAMEMFRANPDFRDAIEACRSTKAKMPNGQVIGPLNKFASMGSALCFPIESMYFYTICVMALLEDNNLPVNYANCLSVGRSVFVYGDDIIVPSANAVSVLDYLQKYRCKVNVNKTYWTGKFRESCGEDAYAGERVTPVYISKDVPRNRHQASALVSWVASANAFTKKGYLRTATFMFCKCEGILGALPRVDEFSAGLGRISTVLRYSTVERWNRDFQHGEILCWTPEPVYRSDHIDGYPALTKSLTMLESRTRRDGDNCRMSSAPDWTSTVEFLDVVDALHLERSAVHGALTLKRRWQPCS